MTRPNTIGLGEYTDADLITELVSRHSPDLATKIKLGQQIVDLLEGESDDKSN